MKIIDILSSQNTRKNLNKNKCNKRIALKNRLNFKSAKSISNNLARKGIRTEFNNNDFFARCAEQTVNLFENLFGKFSLPKSIEYIRLGRGIYGGYYPYSKGICYNSNRKEFHSMDGLKKLAKNGYNFLIPNDFASLHPANTHVHEFAHCAHHSHLDLIHSHDGSTIMEKLRHTQVPTSIGKLITRFKLGNYALDKAGGMNEFMAERITSDVCKNITEEYWLKTGSIDVNYSNIFNRKWNYRYTSPQSYLDYFTQQVWNGNIEEAKKTGDKVEEYLSELDRATVPKTVENITKRAKGSFLEDLANGISGLFEMGTKKLDTRNKLVLKY